MIPIFSAVLVFCATFAACCAVFINLQKKRQIDQRIQAVIPQLILESDEEISTAPVPIRLLQQFLERVNQKLNLKPSRQLALELVRADIRISPGEFLVLNALLGFAPLALLAFGADMVQTLLLAVAAVLSPSFYVKLRQGKRRKKVEQQLPEVLVTIANSLKSGYSFFQAIELVARETEPPLAAEFALVNKEMSLGAPTELALENMVKRVDSSDLELVVTAVLIQRQVGGNLSEVLESIAETIRERIRIKGEISTLTAQGRISGIVISALPFAISFFIYALNPDYIKPLFIEPLGRIMLILGLGGQLSAAVLIHKIVNIRV